MFAHIFISRFKCMARDKNVMFWTFLFPLVLATLYGMAFSNIGKSTSFQGIPIAVVDSAEFKADPSFGQLLASVSGDSTAGQDTKLFHTTFSTKEEAETSLKKNKIDGYIDFTDGPKVFVKSSGINQTILKQFMDHYLQTKNSITTITAVNPAAHQAAISDASKQVAFLKTVPAGRSEPDDTLIYYFGLVAMTALYGGFWGIKQMTELLANQSATGMRMSLTPVHKLKVFGSSILAATLMHMLSVFLLVGYLALALKVNFGNQIGYILLACVVAGFTGVSMGTMIGAVIKKNEGIKVAVLLAVSMSLSFLSGMMVASMKYIVTSALPFMSYLNPANLISDAFYSLYYYDTHTRYFTNIGLLFVFSVLFYLVVYFVLRRQKYASL